MQSRCLKYFLVLIVTAGFTSLTSPLSAGKSHAMETTKNLQVSQEVIDYIEQLKQKGLDEEALKDVLKELSKSLSAKNESTNQDRNKKVFVCLVGAVALGVSVWFLYKLMYPDGTRPGGAEA